MAQAITKRRATVRNKCRLLFGQMPLKVAAIVKDTENVNYALAFAAAVNDEMPGIPHNSKSSARPFSAEAQMIRPDAFLKVAFVLRAWTLHAGLDIEKGLDNQVFIAQGSITAEFRFAPYQNLSKIAAGLNGENGLDLASLFRHAYARRLVRRKLPDRSDARRLRGRPLIQTRCPRRGRWNPWPP